MWEERNLLASFPGARKQVWYFISKLQPRLQHFDPLKSSPGSHSLLGSDSVGITSSCSLLVFPLLVSLTLSCLCCFCFSVSKLNSWLFIVHIQISSLNSWSWLKEDCMATMWHTSCACDKWDTQLKYFYAQTPPTRGGLVTQARFRGLAEVLKPCNIIRVPNCQVDRDDVKKQSSKEFGCKKPWTRSLAWQW